MKVELLKPHTHAGRDYPPGAQRAIDADAADWLIAIGVAKPLTEPASKTKEQLK